MAQGRCVESVGHGARPGCAVVSCLAAASLTSTVNASLSCMANIGAQEVVAGLHANIAPGCDASCMVTCRKQIIWLLHNIHVQASICQVA